MLAADTQARSDALDPGRSFIVQAPAGSGKTELLIQRMLVLLGLVDQPEQVVAITFTRKAAAEMRQRLLAALAAAEGEAPDAPHRRHTWELARRAAEQDRQHGWNLRRNPARIRTSTIDSLCREISSRRPLLSRLGGPSGVTERARPLYREAARATLAGLAKDDERSRALQTLLLHLDNDHGLATELLVRLLARRDQWLRHLGGKPSGGERGGAGLRAALEAGLRRTVGDALLTLKRLVPREMLARLAPLLEYGAANLDRQDGRYAGWQGIHETPDTERPDSLERAKAGWSAAAALLLTGTGTWRKQINRTNGFPTGAGTAKRMKDDALDLIESASGQEDLREALADIQGLPYVRYPETQWIVQEALFRVLPSAVEALEGQFAEAGGTDFTEVSRAAVRALEAGEAEAAEEGIRHLLVDEFQDTSHTQFSLVEALLRGWKGGDGRTLFLVGDPMQSIYRFREAEVGLFLRAWSSGIAELRLQPLVLSVNFRSTAALVNWVNGALRSALPRESSVDKGAVAFAASAPSTGAEPGLPPSLHAFAKRDGGAEGERVASIVPEALAQGSVAVLVRARGHLPAITAALRKSGIRYRAKEIDPLSERPVVQDLAALTRALLHPADRVAWLAVLRAPWCGLRLEDLLRLVAERPAATIWELMPERGETLTDDARARLRRVGGVLETALAGRGRLPVRQWVEETWIALGGPACLDAAGLAEAEAFLSLLEKLDESGKVIDAASIAESMQDLYAPPDPEAADEVNVMTIHAAKGLEFDTVILPGLERGTQADEPQALVWWERIPRGGAAADLLLASIPERGGDDRLYRYLQSVQKEKAEHELGRVLYVAVTRARRRLHLLGSIEASEDGELTPRAGTFLSRLWEGVEDDFVAALDQTPVQAHREPLEHEPAVEPTISRLVSGWSTPNPPASLKQGVDAGGEPALAQAASAAPPDFNWAHLLIRHVGTVVHGALQRMATLGAAAQTREWIAAREARHRGQLLALGLPGEHVKDALARIRTALENTLADPRGRWVLGPHREGRSEWALSSVLDGKPVDVILDRTFVDESGVRWIVDYKSGGHEGGSREEFLDEERERYRPQLERYARVLENLEQRPIRAGLYFPMLPGWREWEWIRQH
jgi:ATP-dependent exoDNAse (exonuclease V) beta subunit